MLLDARQGMLYIVLYMENAQIYLSIQLELFHV